MKRTQFKVEFANGNIETIHAFSIEYCILSALDFAYKSGWSLEIKKITDEKGKIYTNIKIQYDEK